MGILAWRWENNKTSLTHSNSKAQKHEILTICLMNASRSCMWNHSLPENMKWKLGKSLNWETLKPRNQYAFYFQVRESPAPPQHTCSYQIANYRPSRLGNYRPDSGTTTLDSETTLTQRLGNLFEHFCIKTNISGHIEMWTSCFAKIWQWAINKLISQGTEPKVPNQPWLRTPAGPCLPSRNSTRVYNNSSLTMYNKYIHH